MINLVRVLIIYLCMTLRNMKIKTVVLLLVVLVGCRNEQYKEKEYKIGPDKIEIKNVEPQVSRVNLEFEYVSDIIKSTFKIRELKLRNIRSQVADAFNTVLDSTKIEAIEEYSDFLLIEIEDSEMATEEFEKLKAFAARNNIKRDEYHDIFRKGGISFNKLENWIIAHYLRCNMRPKEYEIDKSFSLKLEKLNADADWIRSSCGWTNIELK